MPVSPGFLKCQHALQSINSVVVMKSTNGEPERIDSVR